MMMQSIFKQCTVRENAELKLVVFCFQTYLLNKAVELFGSF